MTHYCIKLSTIEDEMYKSISFQHNSIGDLFVSTRSLDFADTTLFYMEDAFLRRE